MSRNPWWIVCAAFLGVSVSFASIVVFSFGVFIKPLQESFGWTRSQVSLAFSIGALTVCFCSPFLGRLADRIGAKRVILPSAAVLGLAYGSMAFLGGGLAQFYATYVVMGIVGNGATQLTYSRIVSARFDRRRGMALAFVMTGVGVGAMVIPPLACRGSFVVGGNSCGDSASIRQRRQPQPGAGGRHGIAPSPAHAGFLEAGAGVFSLFTGSERSGGAPGSHAHRWRAHCRFGGAGVLSDGSGHGGGASGHRRFAGPFLRGARWLCRLPAGGCGTGLGQRRRHHGDGLRHGRADRIRHGRRGGRHALLNQPAVWPALDGGVVRGGVFGIRACRRRRARAHGPGIRQDRILPAAHAGTRGPHCRIRIAAAHLAGEHPESGRARTSASELTESAVPKWCRRNG